jgi:hypothetical protein
MRPLFLCTSLAALGLATFSLTGCLGDDPRAAQVVPRKEMIVAVPTFTITAGAELIDKEGVKVNATPRMPTKGSFTFVTGFTEKTTWVVINDKKNYQVKSTTATGYTSDYLTIDARIQNTSANVIRLKDASVVVQVDGHLATLDQAAFNEVQKVVVPPGATVSFTFTGPSWGKFQENGDLKIGIYEVPVGEKKVNFEFDYNTKLTPDTLVMTDSYQDLSLSPDQAFQYQQKLNQDRQRAEALSQRTSSQVATKVQ